MTPEQLAAFVRSRMELQSKRPGGAAEIAMFGGIMLWGTLGHAAYLRPDGTVVWCEDGDWSDASAQTTIRPANAQERAAVIYAARDRFPEIQGWMPATLLKAPCGACGGTGSLTHRGIVPVEGVWCEQCLGLGHLVEETT